MVTWAARAVTWAAHMVTWTAHMVTWAAHTVTWAAHMATCAAHMVTWMIRAAEGQTPNARGAGAGGVLLGPLPSSVHLPSLPPPPSPVPAFLYALCALCVSTGLGS
jgi:hypothetical protein